MLVYIHSFNLCLSKKQTNKKKQLILFPAVQEIIAEAFKVFVRWYEISG